MLAVNEPDTALFFAAGLRRVALIAGEASGDLLGANLIEALRARHPTVEFIGMTGPLMRAAGCQSLADIEELSVMGLAGKGACAMEQVANGSENAQSKSWRKREFMCDTSV